MKSDHRVRIPGWKVAICSFIFACLLAGHLSYAACEKTLSKTNYSAVFRMDAQDYRFVIGSQARGGAVQGLLIRLKAGQKDGICEAVCEPQIFEKTTPLLRGGDGTIPRNRPEPIAFQWECRSAKFPALTSTTTLIWGSARAAHQVPQLRFGTWLNGYRTFPLSVETDTFLVTEKSLAAK